MRTRTRKILAQTTARHRPRPVTGSSRGQKPRSEPRGAPACSFRTRLPNQACCLIARCCPSLLYSNFVIDGPVCFFRSRVCQSASAHCPLSGSRIARRLGSPPGGWQSASAGAKWASVWDECWDGRMRGGMGVSWGVRMRLEGAALPNMECVGVCQYFKVRGSPLSGGRRTSVDICALH